MGVFRGARANKRFLEEAGAESQWKNGIGSPTLIHTIHIMLIISYKSTYIFVIKYLQHTIPIDLIIQRLSE